MPGKKQTHTEQHPLTYFKKVIVICALCALMIFLFARFPRSAQEPTNDNPPILWGYADSSSSSSMPTMETNCSDGIDNDANGLVDCEDPACATDPNCMGY
jgi:hypothetical protein